MTKDTPLSVRNTLQLQGRPLALRLFFHEWLNRGTFTAWIHLITRDLPSGLDEAARLRIGGRVFRPYLRPRLSVAGKIALLGAHYRTLGARLPPQIMTGLVEGKLFPVAGLIGKSGATYTLLLKQETSKEGELSFLLTDGGTYAPLSTLRGTIGFDGDGCPVLWIGGLQGAKPPVGRDDIVRATRDLNGLRPKHAVLQAACAFSRWIQIEGLIAPCRAAHISRRGWRRWSRKRRITAEYDEFWSEFVLSRRADGDYRLPVTLPVRAPDAVKSKKRKEWLLRRERLEGVDASVKAALDALAFG